MSGDPFARLDETLALLGQAMQVPGVDTSEDAEHLWQVLETLRESLGGDGGLRDALIVRGLEHHQVDELLDGLATRRRARGEA